MGPFFRRHFCFDESFRIRKKNSSEMLLLFLKVPTDILFVSFLQASDYGTMSQSCQSIPPLNLEDHDYDEDDLGGDISIGYASSGVSRFSDVTIDERKSRIINLIAEIYTSVPLAQGNPTRKSLNQTLRRYASVDQVSDVDSVITSNRPQRLSHPAAKLSRQPSLNSSMRRYASSPKLMPAPNAAANKHINVQNLGPLSTASSMMNLRANKKNSLEEHVNKHMPLRKNRSNPVDDQPKTVQKSQIRPKDPSPSPVRRSKSPPIQPGRGSRVDDEEKDDDDITTIHNNEDQNDDEEEGTVIRGNDIDYVKANKQCATAVGHHRRKEVEAALEVAEQRKKSKSNKPPEKYKTGSVPKYLQQRQASWKEEAERVEAAKPDPDCPAGHRRLPDGDRREALGQMKAQYQGLLDKANHFPVRSDTLRSRQMKAEIENELIRLEEAIRTYERTKVFVK